MPSMAATRCWPWGPVHLSFFPRASEGEALQFGEHSIPPEDFADTPEYPNESSLDVEPARISENEKPQEILDFCGLQHDTRGMKKRNWLPE